MFTNWAVLICYIIGFNIIVTFLLAVLGRAPLPFRHPFDTPCTAIACRCLLTPAAQPMAGCRL